MLKFTQAVKVLLRRKAQVDNLVVSLKACDVFSAAIKNLAINESLLVELAWALDALSESLNQLMTDVHRVIVEDLLEVLKHLGIVSWEIKRITF